ncbi:hypothetical protein DVA76_18970, partial [Acinetobacter baumannii]
TVPASNQSTGEFRAIILRVGTCDFFSLIESILFIKKFGKSSVLNEELLARGFCVSLVTVSKRNLDYFY